MAEITRQQVIDALDIPTQSEIKAAIKLPNRSMVINRMFKDEISDGFMTDVLNISECVDFIAETFSDLSDHYSEIFDCIKNQLPADSIIKTNFRDHFPTRNEILNAIDIPDSSSLIEDLVYPVASKDLLNIAQWLKNKSEFCTKFDLIQKNTLTDALDNLYRAESDDNIKKKILRLKESVPDIITEHVINSVIPDSVLRDTLLEKFNSEISIPVELIVGQMVFYDKNEIIDKINSSEISLGSIEKIIPDIPCKNDVLNLFRNVILDDQAIFEKLGVSKPSEIYDILDIDKIIDTYELPSTNDILASLKLPDQMTAIHAVEDSIPSATNFILSLGIPTPVEICNSLVSQLSYITSDIASDITDILCQHMVTNLSAIQFNMGLRSKVDVINNLINLDGRLPSSNDIRSALHIASYSEIAVKLNFVESNLMVQSLRQFMSNQFNIADMCDDIEEANDIVNEMVNYINPKTIMNELGKDKYSRAESYFKNSGKSSNDISKFLTNGW